MLHLSLIAEGLDDDDDGHGYVAGCGWTCFALTRLDSMAFSTAVESGCQLATAVNQSLSSDTHQTRTTLRSSRPLLQPANNFFLGLEGSGNFAMSVAPRFTDSCRRHTWASLLRAPPSPVPHPPCLAGQIPSLNLTPSPREFKKDMKELHSSLDSTEDQDVAPPVHQATGPRFCTLKSRWKFQLVIKVGNTTVRTVASPQS